jgi:hypothetical protein
MLRHVTDRAQFLTLRQSRVIVRFHEASLAFPDEDFPGITTRLLGAKGFGKSRSAVFFERECLRAFNLGRATSRNN